METVPMKIIARIHSDFPSKFGIPRQSGLVEALKARVVFEPDFRSPEAVRGLEGFSHIWLIWQFSQGGAGGLVPHGAAAPGWEAIPAWGSCHPLSLPAQRCRAVLRPPGAGGAPYPPGPGAPRGGGGPDGRTPIFDIKPYLPYGDCRAGGHRGLWHPGRTGC